MYEKLQPVQQVNLSHYVLPEDIEESLTELKNDLKNGETNNTRLSQGFLQV